MFGYTVIWLVGCLLKFESGKLFFRLGGSLLPFSYILLPISPRTLLDTFFVALLFTKNTRRDPSQSEKESGSEDEELDSYSVVWLSLKVESLKVIK